jgi:hypothetical protein
MALTADDILAILETAASRPKRMSGDAGTVIAQPLQDLIAVHQYLASVQVASASTAQSTGGLNGIRVSKINPSGTVT